MNSHSHSLVVSLPIALHSFVFKSDKKYGEGQLLAHRSWYHQEQHVVSPPPIFVTHDLKPTLKQADAHSMRGEIAMGKVNYDDYIYTHVRTYKGVHNYIWV